PAVRPINPRARTGSCPVPPRLHQGGRMPTFRSMGKVMLAVVAAMPLLVLGATVTTATAASASPAPITIAYITDLTGQGASENSTSPVGFFARIEMQNAEGGVNGHK